jgi:hypothetical protein
LSLIGLLSIDLQSEILRCPLSIRLTLNFIAAFDLLCSSAYSIVSNLNFKREFLYIDGVRPSDQDPLDMTETNKD